MKKLLYTLILFIPLFLFSCASKPVAENSENKPEQNQEISENTEDINTDSNTEETALEVETNTTDDTEVVETEDLTEIDEPEIIDLEPEDDVIEVTENSEVPEEIEVVEEDQIPELSETEEKPEYNIAVLKDDALPAEVMNAVTDLLGDENINVTFVDSSDNSEEAKKIVDDIQTEKENISNSLKENSAEISTENNDVEDIAEISDEETSAEDNETEVITPSRSISLKKFEKLDVKYPGKGWVYMGTTDSDRDALSLISGRKLGSSDSEFQFQANNSGTKILHFYKYDNLKDTYLDDYLEVTILNEKGTPTNHVSAPEFKMPVTKNTKKPALVQNENTESGNTVSAQSESENKETEKNSNFTENKNTEKKSEPVKTVSSEKKESAKLEKSSAVENEFKNEADDGIESVEIDTGKLLQEAKSDFNNKKYSSSLEKLNQFLELSTKNRDEALYYKGQILETSGDIQNIPDAITTYETLTKNYAASKYWDKANKRIIYLKRFYLEGR